MRYVVRFAHSQYLQLVERFAADPEAQVPEGVYRALDVVVEAADPEAALRIASERLGWPDQEMSLVPFAVTSDIESRARQEMMREMRAILDLWKDRGLLDHASVAGAVGMG